MSSEGPGPMVSTRDQIYWDREPPSYVIVTQYARDFTLPDVQSLLSFYGEIMGYNVQLLAVGQPTYGHRWTNYILYDCSSPGYPVAFWEDPENMTPAEARRAKEQKWWDMFWYRIVGGPRH